MVTEEAWKLGKHMLTANIKHIACIFLAFSLLGQPHARAKTTKSDLKQNAAQININTSTEKSRYYCAVAAAKEAAWSEFSRLKRIASQRMSDKYRAVYRREGGRLDGINNDKELASYTEESRSASTKQDAAYSRYLDSLIPILILLGNDQERVLLLRSYLPGGQENQRVWQLDNALKIYYGSTEFAEALDEASNLFYKSWNKEIVTFCNSHGIKL